MPSLSPSLSHEQLEDLQNFLRDWLRHTGRTQNDLRRVLRASSRQMPVLIDMLHRIHADRGLAALAERLCGIEELWHGEDHGLEETDDAAAVDRESSLDQLDLLLEEIRQERQA